MRILVLAVWDKYFETEKKGRVEEMKLTSTSPNS